MIKNFLLFATLLISQKLIICADECSVFSCSQLDPSAETGQTCSYSGTSCESIFTSCGELLSSGDCSTAKVKFTSPTQECNWNAEAQGGAKCELKQLQCSDFASSLPNGFHCEDLKASANKYCITVEDHCVEESGCPSDKDTCTQHKPLDSNNKWDHLRICEQTTDGCQSKLKLCDDYEGNGDDCSKLSTSDNTKKKCVLESASSCVEKDKVCEGYTGTNAAECEAISNYIEDQNIYKCEYVISGSSGNCKKKRKECSDFKQDEELCNNYTPEDSNKKCVFTTIGGTEKCYELPKKCSDLNALTDIKDEGHCKAIKEDPYSECSWESDLCVKNKNKCDLPTHNSALICHDIYINNTHKCEFIDNSCVEVYANCNLYTGNDRTKCEQIIPPESNKRCILQNDKQCVSVPQECESYSGNSEYECINNYKPLDENYKCVFNSGCHKELKYQKEYCYQGDESSTICEAIIPKNNGEKYSIKCKFETESQKCVRVEKPCEDYKEGNAEICSSIIPKDQNKKCILRSSQCKEEYKTCKAYNDDTKATIDKTTCESIISNDGKKCKYTAGENDGRATCASDTTNKCDNTFIDTAVSLSSACASIKLSDISKKCSFSNGECLSKSKSCLELVFNGNEEGIENMCKSAEASANKKCIISSDKKRCLEVDKSLVIEDEPSGPGGNENTNDSTNGNGPNQPEGPNGTEGDKGTEGEKGTEGADESKPNSGKTIYLNSLIAMILFLLL